MKHLTVKGSPADCSFQVGEKFRKEIKVRRHQYRCSSGIVQHRKQLLQIYHGVKQHYPHYLEEIAALAEGSRTDFLELFYLNCPELSRAQHGCSSIAVVNKGQTLLAHNEDGDAFERQDKCALIQYKLPNYSFSSYTYLGELPGNAYSWNSYGLFFAVNYVPVERDLPGIPYYFLTRALGEAKTIKEAVVMLKKSFCASGFHVFIGKGKRIISVEKYGKRTNVKEVKGISFHTNHFIHPGMKSEVRRGSLLRLQRLQELLTRPAQTLDKKRLAEILFDQKNRPYPLYSTKGDKMRTLSTVVVERRRVNVYYKKV